MLKQSLQSSERVALGVGAAVLVMACRYAAWAAQPAVTSSADARATLRGEITLRIGSRPAHAARVLTLSGASFAVADGEGADRWELQGTATSRDDRTIELNAVLKQGDHIVSQPQLVVKEGVPGAIKVGNDKPSSAGDRFKGFDASFVFIRAETGAMNAAARNLAVPARNDQGPSENISYRKMRPPKFPQSAIDAHQTGTITLMVHIDEQGDPESAVVYRAKPAEAEAVFADLSVATVMQWRFNPSIKNGKPRAGDVLIPVAFNLYEDNH